MTSWHDPEAAAPSLTAGFASASNGVYAEFVRLSVSGSAALSGSERSYQVRASTVYGPAASSASVVGSRSPGPLSRAWERSAGTTAQDFTALAGATGASFDDTGAPADGSVRWYRVVVRAEGAPDAVSEAVSGARQPPPGVPGGVAASSELEGYVLVTWAPVAGAVGYHVYRDGAKLTGAGAITQTSYQDAAVGAPVGSWAAPNTVVGSTSSSEEVSVSWRAPGRPLGPQASYTVSAVNAAGEGPLSAAAVGRRAAPALVGFEVEVTPAGGSASWYTTASTATTWVHADPPKGVITGGTISASQGSHRALVRLSSSGASVAQAAYVAYRVRGVLEGVGRRPSLRPGAGGALSGR